MTKTTPSWMQETSCRFHDVPSDADVLAGLPSMPWSPTIYDANRALRYKREVELVLNAAINIDVNNANRNFIVRDGCFHQKIGYALNERAELRLLQEFLGLDSKADAAEFVTARFSSYPLALQRQFLSSNFVIRAIHKRLDEISDDSFRIVVYYTLARSSEMLSRHPRTPVDFLEDALTRALGRGSDATTGFRDPWHMPSVLENPSLPIPALISAAKSDHELAAKALANLDTVRWDDFQAHLTENGFSEFNGVPAKWALSAMGGARDGSVAL